MNTEPYEALICQSFIDSEELQRLAYLCFGLVISNDEALRMMNWEVEPSHCEFEGAL